MGRNVIQILDTYSSNAKSITIFHFKPSSMLDIMSIFVGRYHEWYLPKKYRYNIRYFDIIFKKYLKISVDILIFFRYRKKKYRYYIWYLLYIWYISDILDIYLRFIWYNIWYISDFLDIYLIFFGMKISKYRRKYPKNMDIISIKYRFFWKKTDIYQIYIKISNIYLIS